MMLRTPPEWVVIHMKNGKNLFLSSELAVNYLSIKHNINRENIADMRSIYEEMVMDGKKALTKFMNILDGIRDLEDDIIIHCHLGLNRTPVAAAIFLTEKMNYHPSTAQSVVEKVLRKRKSDYVLNELGLYDSVLQEAEKRYVSRNAPTLHKTTRSHTREVDSINLQKLNWYGS